MPELLGRPSPVAVCASHFTLRDFFLDSSPAAALGDHVRDITPFTAADMVEFQDNGISFTAVHTCVVRQILGY